MQTASTVYQDTIPVSNELLFLFSENLHNNKKDIKSCFDKNTWKPS